MEYIKQFFIDNSVLAYGMALFVVILILGISFFFIRRNKLNSQSIGAINNDGSAAMDQINGINNAIVQDGVASTLSRDQALNTLMNSEEIVNNSFVISAEENAAKRVADIANNINSTRPSPATNTAVGSNVTNNTNIV